jgi:hypothetical protein
LSLDGSEPCDDDVDAFLQATLDTDEEKPGFSTLRRAVAVNALRAMRADIVIRSWAGVNGKIEQLVGILHLNRDGLARLKYIT